VVFPPANGVAVRPNPGEEVAGKAEPLCQRPVPAYSLSLHRERVFLAPPAHWEMLHKGFYVYPKSFVRYEQLIIFNGSDVIIRQGFTERIVGCCLPLPLALVPWCVNTQSHNASDCTVSILTLGLQSTFLKQPTALVSGTSAGNITCSPSIFFLSGVMEIQDSLVAEKRTEFSSFSYQKYQKTLKFSVDQ